MDFRVPQNVSFGVTETMAYSLQQEDLMYQEKTQLLLKRLSEIEKKSKQMRNETERLRKLKDEAKQTVMENFPHLFKKDINGIQGLNRSNHIRVTEDELEMSETSFSSGDMTNGPYF